MSKPLHLLALFFFFGISLGFADKRDRLFDEFSELRKEYKGMFIHSSMHKADKHESYKTFQASDCWGFVYYGRIAISKNTPELDKIKLKKISNLLKDQYQIALKFYQSAIIKQKAWLKENPKQKKKDYPVSLPPKPKKPKIKVTGSLIHGETIMKTSYKKDQPQKNKKRQAKSLSDSKKNVEALIQFHENIFKQNEKLAEKNLAIQESIASIEGLPPEAKVDMKRLSAYVDIPTELFNSTGD